ncbi:zinc ABC transporter substrate-binding protein [Virgibacillus sp. YIM 98842]|uniref:metal ABC transporter solute-binding protein, Zn/Mn family n=1 Tax=Virgibacillus sp. YIM 98842 TaxID=2663533 RepID=UPI001F0981A9|nr:zinc ABC transporter substrate-binding protein [Virgibacillus sp. YIM 98842]
MKRIVILSFILFLAACGTDEETGSESANDADKINIVTTIAQIGEPLSVIGGDRVEVNSLMGPSVDPHLYQATQGDISTIDEADLIFYNGLDLEANMVDIFNEISESKPVLALGETISPDALLEDEEGAIDPHIWFDFHLWEEALFKAVEELKAYAPDDAEYFEENWNDYLSELEEVKQHAEKLADIPAELRVLVTAHDAFGYFGNLHDIEVIGLQGLSTEGEVGISDINETIEIIKENQVPAIFVETSINDSTIQAVLEGAQDEDAEVELGGELYSDAMGEAGTEEGTYIGMYKHNVDIIYEALTGEEAD